ncbi:uncharacterized protein LOC125176407 [Prionailurus viverrinus]|uniref:uncharacterized protein LOC125176407 n=1 Tax=Prionailurus viverrinus TaxID=61388 RepID=UPI001FF287C6|nr:uncharacterized protein LOC125176407 [Prionailurus viverrinus]
MGRNEVLVGCTAVDGLEKVVLGESQGSGWRESGLPQCTLWRNPAVFVWLLLLFQALVMSLQSSIPANFPQGKVQPVPNFRCQVLDVLPLTFFLPSPSLIQLPAWHRGSASGPRGQRLGVEQTTVGKNEVITSIREHRHTRSQLTPFSLRQLQALWACTRVNCIFGNTLRSFGFNPEIQGTSLLLCCVPGTVLVPGNREAQALPLNAAGSHSSSFCLVDSSQVTSPWNSGATLAEEGGSCPSKGPSVVLTVQTITWGWCLCDPGAPPQAAPSLALAQAPRTTCLWPVSRATPVTSPSLRVLTCHMVTSHLAFLPSD